LIHDAKTPCGIGLLIHVGAFQMNTTHLQSAVPKPGGSDLRKQDPFKGKNTTICRGLTKQKTAYGGFFSRFGFAAVFRVENRVSMKSFLLAAKANKAIRPNRT
jgi:hypothetical protein